MRLLTLVFLTALLPQAARADWLEASSANFVVYADDSEKNLRQLSEQLELYHHAMERVTRRDIPDPSPSNRVVVYIVRNERQVQRLYGDGARNIGGFYIPRAGGSVAIVPRVRARSGRIDESMMTLLHEYAHHFVTSNSTMEVPAWVSEGSAEFFAAADFPDEGGIRLGKPADHRAAELYYERAVPVEKLLDPAAYQDGARTGYDSFYVRSWALYHYLTLGSPPRRGQLERYLRLLSEGGDWRSAATEAFGDLQQLDTEIATYLKRRTMNALHFKAGDLPTGATAVRPLPPGHAAMMPVIIQSRRGVNEEEAAALAPEARKIAAAHPRDPMVLAALAEAEYDTGEYDRAIAAADAALALDPKLPNAYVQKGYALFAKASSAEDREQAVRRAVEPFLALNKLENDHPIPLLYYYLGFLERDTEPTENAVRGLERAIELAPFDIGLRLLLTRQQITVADFDGARRNLRHLAAHPHATELAQLARIMLERIDASSEPKVEDLLAMLEGPAGTESNQ